MKNILNLVKFSKSFKLNKMVNYLAKVQRDGMFLGEIPEKERTPEIC